MEMIGTGKEGQRIKMETQKGKESVGKLEYENQKIEKNRTKTKVSYSVYGVMPLYQ
jgi:hypothetical protein